eukprot:scaffold107156_cov27-Phaeocystis_antarctica.AAC.1
MWKSADGTEGSFRNNEQKELLSQQRAEGGTPLGIGLPPPSSRRYAARDRVATSEQREVALPSTLALADP